VPLIDEIRVPGATRRSASSVPVLSALLVAVALALVGCAGGNGSAAPAGAATGLAGGSSGGARPTPAARAATDWPLPADPSAAVAEAGLPMLGEEQLAVHYHAHLDVIVNGVPVTVPAGIGIDERRQKISPLHTHDTTGVVHIESADARPFTLGELFAEWGQPFTDSQVGPVSLTGGEVLRVYRNGTPIRIAPAILSLAAHDEIVVWVGPAGATPRVPSGYAFPAGL
jgi:hypothetical protein